MKRTCTILGIVTILAVLAALILPGFAVWDGHFRLDVNVKSRSSSPICHVDYAMVPDWNRSESMSSDKLVQDYPFEAVRGFDGARSVLDLPCSGREWLGIEFGYVEPYRFLLLRVDYGNGKRLKTIAEIPKGREPRNLTVEVP
jgi:hypothetical protein